jgi:signal transduction histidine kinase
MTTLAPLQPGTRFKSILSRIVFLHVIALAIISVLMPLALHWLLAREAERLHLTAMRDLAETLADYLAVDASSKLTLQLPPDLKAMYSANYGRYAYGVVDENGRVLFSSLKDNAAIFPSNTPTSEPAFRRAMHGDLELSGVSTPKQIGGRTVWIHAAENLSHRDVIIDDIVADFLRRAGWITLPILLILLAIDIVIFRRALLPLAQASERARSISPVRTDIRLPLEDMPREVLPLVQSINQALDRLEHGFNTQREFIADAAHELRTPLSVLRTRIDTFADQSTVQALRQDLEGVSRVINQLLDVAELDTYVVAAGEKADLHQICSEVVELIAPLALVQGKDIALSSANGPVWVNGDHEMLYRAIRNLAENAINHTPKGTTVEIMVDLEGKVSVLDDGPGIPAHKQELIFQRFWRADRRRVGAGLGLAIVQRIAEAHGGTITYANRPNGGAQFSLRLRPAASDHTDTATKSSVDGGEGAEAYAGRLADSQHPQADRPARA